MTTSADVAASPAGRVRAVVWVIHMTLPVLALWLLLAQPDVDLRWQHRPSHFWLVLAVAAVNVVLAQQVIGAARTRGDARLLLVGYAFTLAAGFLLLHALATPGVLVAGPNGGFEIATPVGLAAASLFVAAASIPYGPGVTARIVGRERATRLALIGLMVVWGAVSLAGLPPLADPVAEQAVGALRWVATVSIGLYLYAALRFFLTHRRRPAVMLIALITASTLLAEAMATIVFARTWQLSWWLWHLLMAAGFGFVAYSAYVQYRREGGSAGIFDGVVSPHTAQAIRREYEDALETLTGVLERSAHTGVGEEELDLITAGLRARFGLTEGQGEVLGRAARALAGERDQARRLGALAAVGTEATVEAGERAFLRRVVAVVGDRFAPDALRIGLAGDGVVAYPEELSAGAWTETGDRHVVDVTARGERVAVLEFSRPHGRFADRDVAIIDTLAAEVGIALDNLRLYDQIDQLFGLYLSPDVADSLRADPTRSDLGGSLVELTALFADLRGFTSFSERTDPDEVMALLNRYFGLTVPIVLRHGGTVVQFVGDALLAVFDAPTPRPDHAFRAATAALGMQHAIERTAEGQSGWPRFRIGINTGLAVIGNVGSAEFRSFNVVGDAVNVAARLETSADPGTVLIGEATHRLIADRVDATPVGRLELKGKDLPIEAYRLDRLSTTSHVTPIG